LQGFYTIAAQNEWVFKTEHQATDLNTGISIVVPVSKVLETINQDALQGETLKIAQALDEQIRQRSGAKSAAAVSADDASLMR
jgi:hypothetical protein